jgi:molecular chaperone DnaK (HSP70)
MDVLRDDLAEALEDLEEGEKEKAHDLIEEHLERATRMRRAVERLEAVLDDHIDALDDLSHRTEDVDIASIRESIDELRGAMDEDERIRTALDDLEAVFADGS